MLLRTVCGIAAMLCMTAPVYAQSASQEALSKMEREMLCPSVLIDTPEATGTGTVIRWLQKPDGVSEIDVLTNKHVLEELINPKPKKKQKGKKAQQAKGKNEEKRIAPLIVKMFTYETPAVDSVTMRPYAATIVAHGKDRDLAVVRIKGAVAGKPCVAALAPKGTMPRRMDNAWVAGSPLGYEPNITQGRFGSVDLDMPKQAPRLVASAPIAMGNSGGCLYHFARDRYECVGVTTILAADDDDKAVPHVNLSITIDAVYEFLEQSGLGHIAEGQQAQ